MHYPKNLGATASSSYILGLCGGLCNRRLFARRPTNKRSFKKMTCTRSAFLSIPHPAKSTSKKPTRSSDEEAEYQIPKFECVFKIPKDLMKGLPM
jgi:hypothetical protein